MMAMTMPMATNNMISPWRTSQKRGSFTPPRLASDAASLLDQGLAQSDRNGVRTRVRLKLADHALGVGLGRRDTPAEHARALFGVVALRKQLKDLALAL